MNIADNDRFRAQALDRFKTIVALGLLLLMALLLLKGCTGSGVGQPPTAAAPAVEVAAPAAEVAAPAEEMAAPAEVVTAPAVEVTAPPVQVAAPSLNPPQVGDGGIHLSGLGQPGGTVELWAGDVKLGSVPVGADGTWSWDGMLAAGDHSLVARTVDAAEKVLNESSALALTIPAAAAAVAPTLQPPQVDAQGALALSGTAQPGTTVEILVDGAVLGTAVAAADGTWALLTQVGADPHTVAVRSQGDPSLVSASAQVEVPAAGVAAGDTGAADVAGAGEAYIVKRGDSLSALAVRFYDNWKLWRLILDATNERAAQDPTFATIAKPNLILPGWKLWIPAQ